MRYCAVDIFESIFVEKFRVLIRLKLISNGPVDDESPLVYMLRLISVPCVCNGWFRIGDKPYHDNRTMTIWLTDIYTPSCVITLMLNEEPMQASSFQIGWSIYDKGTDSTHAPNCIICIRKYNKQTLAAHSYCLDIPVHFMQICCKINHWRKYI